MSQVAGVAGRLGTNVAELKGDSSRLARLVEPPSKGKHAQRPAVAIQANGTADAVNLGGLPSCQALIPGVLHACRASAADLGGYLALAPEPGSSVLWMAGLLGLGAGARRGLRCPRGVGRPD